MGGGKRMGSRWVRELFGRGEGADFPPFVRRIVLTRGGSIGC